MEARLSRRRTLSGAATAGLALPALVACADDAGTATAPSQQAPGDPSAAAEAAPSDPTGPASAPPDRPAEGTGEGAGEGLVAAADVPVGGGVVLGEAELVVTQPVAGEFKAFSALCTHNRCLLGPVADGEILCACHRSTFRVSDGVPTVGPASKPLPQVPVRVFRGQVVRG